MSNSWIRADLTISDGEPTIMFMFGMSCVRCSHEIIAPRETELLDDKVIRHLWHCPNCKARFESFPRFPKGAKLVKDVMRRDDVFPPLSGT
jgi:hypothetical protein